MSLKPGEAPRNPRGKPYKILAVRPLTEADLPALREKSAPLARLASIRDSHHRVARLMASGLTNAQIALSTGHSLAAMARYRRDPAMDELVAHYRALLTEDWLEAEDHFTTLAMSNMLKAERMLGDKLDKADEEDDLPTFRDLVAITIKNGAISELPSLRSDRTCAALWFPGGSTCVRLYCIYGGADGTQATHDRTSQWVREALLDAEVAGMVPALIAGDLNLEIEQLAVGHR